MAKTEWRFRVAIAVLTVVACNLAPLKYDLHMVVMNLTLLYMAYFPTPGSGAAE